MRFFFFFVFLIRVVAIVDIDIDTLHYAARVCSRFGAAAATKNEAQIETISICTSLCNLINKKKENRAHTIGHANSSQANEHQYHLTSII